MIDNNHAAERIDVPTPEETYPIFVGSGVLGPTELPTLLAPRPANETASCAIVTNTRIASLFGNQVETALIACGYAPNVIEIPDGEKFKTLDTVNGVYDRLIDARLDRGSTIFGMGGGVVGDLAGFAAATYLRGVPYVQIPTTLLAMVDASIGGKVAVDHPRGKNLIGAFKQPRAILADTDTLASLPDVEWRSGMAEVVKHAIIADAGLFGLLEESTRANPLPRANVADWIVRAMRVKVDIVTVDPFEKNERAKLNLGHTFGHALEQVSRYELRHGEGVAIGLVCAAELATQLGMCEIDLRDRVERLLTALGLPTRIPHELPTDALFQAMQTDKKRAGGQLRFVLPRGIGAVSLVEGIRRDEVLGVIEDLK